MTQLSKIQDQFIMSDEHIETLTAAGIIPEGTPPAIVGIFSEICNTKNLNPFTKQIYLTGYKNRKTGETKYSFITSIDGYRSLSERTGLHAGTDAAKFNGNYTLAQCVQKGAKAPFSASVTVYKFLKGQRIAFTHEASFSEFSSGQQKWLTMPFQMLAKVAESHALRKAFPEAVEGLHTDAEIGAFENNDYGVPPVVMSEEEFKMEALKEDLKVALHNYKGEDKKAINKEITDHFNNGTLDENTTLDLIQKLSE